MGITVKLKPGDGPTTPACGMIQRPGTVRPTAPSTARTGTVVIASAAPIMTSFQLPIRASPRSSISSGRRILPPALQSQHARDLIPPARDPPHFIPNWWKKAHEIRHETAAVLQPPLVAVKTPAT